MGREMSERTYTWDDRRVPRPATGKTPIRNVRVAEETWTAALARAKREGTTLSAVIVEFLEQYAAAGDTDGRPQRKE
jgi:hypothetical protein